MMRIACISLMATIVLACEPGVSNPIPPVTRVGPECQLAVVASDYSASAISLLTAEGDLCAEAVLHSGSATPGLVTALSGDIALPSTPDPAGRLVLIDRYPNAVVTLMDLNLDPIAVTGQWRVSPGWAGNPQDIAWIPGGASELSGSDSDLAYITRQETRLDPDAPDAERGGDIIIVDAADGQRLGRIDLNGAADPGFLPKASRMAQVGGLVFVGLAHLSADFNTAGPGRIVVINPTTHTIVHRIELPGMTNCGANLVPNATGTGLWVVCSGLYIDGLEQQLAQSGVAWIDASDPGIAPKVAWTKPASHFGERPFGLSITSDNATGLFIVVPGDLTAGTPDEVIHIDRTPESAEPSELIGQSQSPFGFGGVFQTDSNVLLVTDADPKAPHIRRFSMAGQTESTTVDISPITGLPPRSIARFR